MKAADLDTPALLLDAGALRRNIARMAELAVGLRHRPHAKTHKSPEIARRQMEAGAVGICCAKLGEAEAMAAAGIDNILITTPVIGESKIGRLLHLRNRSAVAVVADDEANIAMLGRSAQLAGTSLDVLVEIDVGQGRCGVPPGPDAVRLARAVRSHPLLKFAGIQGYQGRIQMVGDAAERSAATDAALDLLDETAAALAAAGLPAAVRTGGGTGSSPFDLGRDSLTEIQPGSYVFMDTAYGGIGWPGAEAPPFEQALHVLTAIVSRPVPGRAVADAGLKAVSSDHGPPRIVDAPSATFEFGGDEHGVIRMRDESAVPFAVGDKLRLVPGHCDTTVNLHDHYMVAEGDDVVDVWPVAARGRFQ